MRMFLSALVALVCYTAQAGAVDLAERFNFAFGPQAGYSWNSFKVKNGGPDLTLNTPVGGLKAEVDYGFNGKKAEGLGLKAKASWLTSLQEGTDKTANAPFVYKGGFNSFTGLLGPTYTVKPGGGHVDTLTFSLLAGGGYVTTKDLRAKGFGLTQKVNPKGGTFALEGGVKALLADSGWGIDATFGYSSGTLKDSKNGVKGTYGSYQGLVGVSYNF